MKTPDLFTKVTDAIVADLKKGARPWHRPWASDHPVSIPLRVTGIPYKGINILLLWMRSIQEGYLSPYWMTFKQAKRLGGHIMKGQSGTPVVFVKKILPSEEEDEDEERKRPRTVLKTYVVFNVGQIEDLPRKFHPKAPERLSNEERNLLADLFIESTGAEIRHEGIQAFYVPSEDYIQMPKFGLFEDAEGYYAILLHELTHWTGNFKRLDRLFARKSEDKSNYAFEELVAELGAAFLCAHLKITPQVREAHVSYIDSWLKILKDDPRAIFRAAGYAEKAVSYLMGLQDETLQVAFSGQEQPY